MINQIGLLSTQIYEGLNMVLPAPQERYERLKNLLVEARENAELTQVELANKLHRPQSFVSKIERGLRRVDVIEFLEIAKAVGFSPSEFLEELNYDKGKR